MVNKKGGLTQEEMIRKTDAILAVMRKLDSFTYSSLMRTTGHRNPFLLGIAVGRGIENGMISKGERKQQVIGGTIYRVKK